MDAARGSDPAEQRLLSCFRVAAVRATPILYQTHSLLSSCCCLLLRSGCSGLAAHRLGTCSHRAVIHEVVATLGLYLACHLLRRHGAPVDAGSAADILHGRCDRGYAHGLAARIVRMRTAHLQ